MSDKLFLVCIMALGFALSGFIVAMYRALYNRPAAFDLLYLGGTRALAAVPFVFLAGPALVMAPLFRPQKYLRGSVVYAMLLSMFATLWAFACGRLVWAVSLWIG